MNYSRVREVKKLERGTEKSAGLDFFIPEFTKQFIKDFTEKNVEIDLWPGESKIVLHPGQRCMIPSGIKAKIPAGKALIAFNKSGISTKFGLDVGACVVDEDYQGEIHISLFNVSSKSVDIYENQKIVQFVLLDVSYKSPNEVELEDLYQCVTERGDGGFGHTDKK